MVRIELVTSVSAPVERCFDLSRSIDLHMSSTDWTGERAIAGITSGLIGKDQEVTWQGRHFGIQFHHSSRITAYDPPYYFQDCMVRGAFEWFCHDHYFTEAGDTTVMKDLMQFRAPLGVLGRLIEPVLESHMRKLLRLRNDCIKRTAESGSWKNFLPLKEGQF